MKGLNKVMLIGNLGDDPVIRDVNEKKVCNMSIATTLRYNDEDYTEWHRLVVWGTLAEIAGKYLQKGDRIYVEGRLRTREYEDSEEITRYTTEVIVRELIMLSSKKSDDDQTKPKTGNSKSKKSKSTKKRNQSEEVPF